MATHYAVNYASKKRHIAPNRFAFQAPGDADARAIAAVLAGALQAQQTTLTTYIQFFELNRGDNHTEGNDRSARITITNKAGGFQTFHLRNVRDDATEANFRLAFNDPNQAGARILMPDDSAPDAVSVALRQSGRGDAVTAEEGDVSGQ